jgi:hypothetical protein
MRTALLCATALALALGGCGGMTPAAPTRTPAPAPTASRATTPQAGPAVSPPLTRRPAGRVVRVGARPDAVGADVLGRQFAVAVHDPARLVLVGSSSGRVTQRVAVPGAVPRPGDPTPAVFLLQGLTGRDAVAVSSAARPASAAVALGRTFVTVGGEVDVLGRNGPVAHFSTATTAIAAADAATHLAVLSGPRRVLELYDPRTLRRIASVAAPAGATHLATLDDQVFVTDTAGNALLTYATQPRLHRVAHRRLAGAPYAIAVDAVHRVVAVTLTADNGLTLIPLTDPTAATTLPTIRQPDALAIDSSTSTIAVASPASGTLQLISRGERPDAEPASHARSGG